MAYPTTTAQWTVQPKQGLATMKRSEVAIPALQDDDVLVRIEAVSLNYRDAGIPNDNYPLPSKADLVPCSDAAGTVIAVGRGAAAAAFAPGDRVCSIFTPLHQAGTLSAAALRNGSLGGSLDGVLQQHRVFAASALIRAPAGLSFREAAALPCAAVTAWNCLFGLEGRKLQPGDTLLTQGTGGVSLFAVQFAAAIGARVIATTSAPAKEALLRRLGAQHVINYREDARWGETARALADGGDGVHHVVEVGGPGTMVQSLRAVRAEGVVSVVGFLSGVKAGEGETASFAELMRTLAIVRKIQVGSKQMFAEMNAFIEKHELRPVLDSREFTFDEAPEALQYLWDAKHTGKIVIDVGEHKDT